MLLRQIIATIWLNFALFSYAIVVNPSVALTVTEPVTRHFAPVTVTSEQIMSSVDFLLQCKYFKETWPGPWQALQSGQAFHVLVPPTGPKGFCGQTFPGREATWILLYPATFTEQGCFGPNPMHTLSHEMLHQVGLPPHFLSPATKEYWQTDPIEVTMRKCTEEATTAGKRIMWPSEGGSL